VIFVENDSYISLNGGTPVRPLPGATYFNESLSVSDPAGNVGAASELFSLDSSGFGADGQAQGLRGVGLADSLFDIQFTVDRPTRFLLEGSPRFAE
jgi:hypothetical protein